MADSWTLAVKGSIAPGRASLPASWFQKPGHENARYVRIINGKQALTLIAQPASQPEVSSALRTGPEYAELKQLLQGKGVHTVSEVDGQDGQIHVSPGTFGLNAEDTVAVQAVPQTLSDVRRQRAREAVTGLGLVGLIVAVAGLAMEGFISFNQHYPVWNGSNLAIGLMSAFSPFMQLVGAILVFVKSTFFGTIPTT